MWCLLSCGRHRCCSGQLASRLCRGCSRSKQIVYGRCLLFAAITLSAHCGCKFGGRQSAVCFANAGYTDKRSRELIQVGNDPAFAVVLIPAMRDGIRTSIYEA
jgi:hypothetical protein